MHPYSVNATISKVRLSCRARSIEACIFLAMSGSYTKGQVTRRPVNKMSKIRPHGYRCGEWRSQKRKNLQELYIATTSIAGMDAIYLLLLGGLYLITHVLVRALNRLGKTP